ncbi:dihydrodipicolinate synthase family protein [Actinoallomurus rhizosphaericola]|uniref:dihydrodipicolinate synthase family protein n=1 Tax=Actinoallomurus rhizosphaericola TaxID=2952536 RepID=UPI0020917FB8|nr:dihydrodipicolinate synthase family protein [Actinoallomurus rhizosphaericola]MCO5994492.1 dihydrodipicolinate synthase family protein [Actinoallomurus rhizosphaericola]
MLHGIHVPLVTPFGPDGALDVPSLERLAHHVLAEGAAGLVVLATTGEAALLTGDERRTVIVTCRKISERYGTPLTVGVGTIGTDESVRQAIDRAADADLLLAVVPYYLRPSDEGVRDHFAAIAAAAGVPLILYNIPYRTGKTLRVETLLDLLATPYVAGIKHCAGAIDADTLTLLAEGRGVLGGDDAFLYPLLHLGAAGGITASANVAPAAFTAMADAVRHGAASRARELHNALLPLVNALFAEPSPSVIKAVLAERGLIADATVRSPLRPPTAASLTTALERLRTLES